MTTLQTLVVPVLALSYALCPDGLAQCSDPYGANDTCATAARIAPGDHRPCATGDDYFAFTVPDGDTVNVTTYSSSQWTVLLDPATCEPVGYWVTAVGSVRSAVYTNCTGGDIDLVARVVQGGPFLPANGYDLRVWFSSHACTPGDLFDFNNSCATSSYLPEGNHCSLRIDPTDPDFYRTHVPDGARVDVEVRFDHAVADIDAFLHHQDCAGGVLDASIGASDVELVSWINDTGEATQVVIEPRLVDPDAQCSVYRVYIEIVYPECAGEFDDAMERDGGDSCADAIPIFEGAHGDLLVSDDDEDFYSISVLDGRTLVAMASFDGETHDLDLSAYAAEDLTCGTNYGAASCGTVFSTALACSRSNSDSELIEWTNRTGQTVEVVLWVDRAGGQPAGCTRYDLVVHTAPADDGSMGAPVCGAAKNSGGVPASLKLVGSDVASENELVVQLDGLPQGAMCLLLNARRADRAVRPAGSWGDLCIGGGIGRYARPGEILSADLFGSASLALDLTDTPTPAGRISAQAGETWLFQGWYRDALFGASNFTDARAVVLR